MSGGGIQNMVSQMGQPSSSSGGFSNSGGSQQPAQPQMNWQTGQPVAQPTQPQPAQQWQPSAPNTGWNQPMFATDPTKQSPTQRWWLGNEGTAATALENQKARAALPADQQAGYTPMTNQQALNQTLRSQIQQNMGNYQGMVDYANQTGISQGDIATAAGVPYSSVYTYMNRPNYQQYSPNGQYNPTIYQPSYQNYNTGNAMGVSQYGQGPDYYGAGLAQMMSTPFNPYSNSYQTPFSAQQAQPNYGPSQAIVSRSAGMRGTPNVVRRAEGGIASLVNDE